MKFDKLIGKKITLFTRKNYRFQGRVTDFDGKFLELFDEVRQKPKNIHIDNIVEFEVDDDDVPDIRPVFYQKKWDAD